MGAGGAARAPVADGAGRRRHASALGPGAAPVRAAWPCSRSCCAARPATRTASMCCSTSASTRCCAAGSAAPCAGTAVAHRPVRATRASAAPAMPATRAGHAGLDGLFHAMAVVSVAVYAGSVRRLVAAGQRAEPVLIAVLFVGEHLVRYRLHPEFERARLVDAVRAFYGASVDPAARRLNRIPRWVEQRSCRCWPTATSTRRSPGAPACRSAGAQFLADAARFAPRCFRAGRP